MPLSADIARCETIRDYAKQKKITVSVFQSDYKILGTKGWQRAFDPWLTHARALGTKLISIRCGFDVADSIDSQLPELSKRLTNLAKRSLRYKVRLVLESDELTQDQLNTIQSAQEEGFLLNTLSYAESANADELAEKVTALAKTAGFGFFPMRGIADDALGQWVRAMAASGFEGVILPVNQGVVPELDELKITLSTLKKNIEEAQGS